MDAQIARWAKLVGIKNASDGGDLIGLFQYFRPDGVGVEAVFDGLPLGPEVLERVKQVYAATRDGFPTNDAYFIPRPPKQCGEEDARQLLQRHFNCLAQIAAKMQDEQLAALLSAVSLTRVRGFSEEAIHDDSPDGWIYEMVTDYLRTTPTYDTPIRLLRDAFWSIANDVFLQSYLLWPLYSRTSDSEEPFFPYFNLWARGVSYSFQTPEACLFLLHPDGHGTSQPLP